MRTSLRTKILVLVAGTIATMAGLVLVSLALLTQHQIDRLLRNDVRSTGTLLTQLIRERSEALTDQCRLIASQSMLLMVIGTGDPPTASDSARDIMRQIRADDVMMTDRDGKLLGSADGARAFVDMAADPGVAAALQGREWSGVLDRDVETSPRPSLWKGEGGRTDQLVLAVCVPVFKDGAIFGTFTGYRRIDDSTARELSEDLGTDVAFVANGSVTGASLPWSSMAGAALPTKPLVPTTIRIAGTSYLAMYAPLTRTRGVHDTLGFIALRNYKQAAAPYHSLYTALGLVFGVSLMLALIVGGVLSRSLTDPLSGVIAAAHTIRSGAWPPPFVIGRTDEIGLLQAVFNEMTSSVREGRERLVALIDSDPLTGLMNHHRFQERLVEECARATASGESLTLVLASIDRFQQYNQKHGHACGDTALTQISQMLADGRQEITLPARYAGDQFAVLLPNQALDQARSYAESLRDAICHEWRNTAGENELTVSVGVAEFGTNTKQADGLILAADIALTRAKQLGRNRVCSFDSVPGADDTADPYQLHRFLKDESLATIQALAAAVDAKDPYTRGHSQSVAQYASDLAVYIGMSPADVELVHVTGTLHDVGKIGVPDSILKKPGRLTDEERTIMETHPGLGEAIVCKVPSLAATIPGVRHHHERWDGRGYPDSLAGENIPRLARILAIADAFDAMTSHRPYRNALPLSVAVEQIEKGSGSQFDPELAAAFLSMMQDQTVHLQVA